MKDVSRWLGHTNTRHIRQTRTKDRGIASPERHTFFQISEHHATDRALHLKHPPIGAKRFVKPTEARRVLPPMGRIIAFPVILVAPGLLPDHLIGDGKQPSLPASCNDLVLTEGKRSHVSQGSHWNISIAGPMRLCSVFNHE